MNVYVFTIDHSSSQYEVHEDLAVAVAPDLATAMAMLREKYPDQTLLHGDLGGSLPLILNATTPGALYIEDFFWYAE